MRRRFAIFILGLSVLAAGCGGKVSSNTNQPDTEQAQVTQEDQVTEQSELPTPQEDVLPEEPPASEEQSETEVEASDPEEATIVTEDNKEATNQDGQSSNAETVTPVAGQAEVLDAIITAMPGSAGSSLKTMSAAVTLLDWTMDTGANASRDQIVANAKAWAEQQAGNGVGKEALLEALDSVCAEAVLIKTDPEGVADQLSDAGVELTRDYSSADVEGVCGILREGIQSE